MLMLSNVDGDGNSGDGEAGEPFNDDMIDRFEQSESTEPTTISDAIISFR